MIAITNLQCTNNGQDQQYPNANNYTFMANGTITGPSGSISLVSLDDASGYSTYDLQCGTWTATHVWVLSV